MNNLKKFRQEILSFRETALHLVVVCRILIKITYFNPSLYALVCALKRPVATVAASNSLTGK